jgi:tripartite-type tricarboxylate transporter receptor subunit TctC
MVTLPRRQVLKLAAGAAALPALSRAAFAQAYPARPVRLLVGYAPGGVADILGRLVAQWLAQRLPGQFVVENRPGAAGNLATEVVVKSPPDGHTLIVLGSNNAINATLYDNLPFDVLRDIVPIAGFLRTPLVMEVNPSVPARTVAEFIAYAKAHPGKVNMGSGGNGSTPHVAGELFKMMAGVDMVHVPYRGTGAMFTDFLGGQVQVAFDNVPSSIGYIRAGQLRALAVTTATRLDVLPDVPTVAESVPGFEAIGWTGLGAPRNTPSEVVAMLNREVNAALADPIFKARLADLGGIPLAGSSAEFTKFFADDTQKWSKVVRAANLKAE